MRTVNDATYVVTLYLSGPIEVAKQALRAECRQELASLPASLGYEFTHLRRLDAALAGSAADRLDAERYRWLRGNRSVIGAGGIELDVFDEDGSLLFYNDLDRAIDAVRAAVDGAKP